MELIKRLKPRKGGTGRLQSWGLFSCPYCKREVEKQLTAGRQSTSCRCAKDTLIGNKNRKHGGKGTRLYQTWANMKDRCYNPNQIGYINYRTRGITVCDEWKNNFVTFRDWALANGYRDDLMIDRIDNNGNYEPGNCRFVSYTASNRNKGNIKLTIEKAKQVRELYKTGKYYYREIAKIFGVSSGTIGLTIRNAIWRDL